MTDLPRSIASPQPPVPPPLVLVADDDRALRKLLNLALSQEGYRVAQASNGEQAIQDFERLQPDMVLLDAVMPDRDGFDCCRHLRTVLGSDVPILMVTVLDDQASVDRAFEAGATDFITKPIHWAVLSQRVKRLVSSDLTRKQIQRVQAELNAAHRWETVQRQLLARMDSLDPSQPLGGLLAGVLSPLQQVFGSDGLWVYDGTTNQMLKLDGSAPAQAAEPIAHLAEILDALPAKSGDCLESPQSPAVQTLTEALSLAALLMAPIVVAEKCWGWMFIGRQQAQEWTPLERDRIKDLSRLLAISLQAYKAGF
ncbi:MAG: response regulator [Cyanobacteria bacterium]|nr:response regulator [Cyanobacteriota bacterium]